MKIYKLNHKQTLPINRSDCWNFFSNPANLQKITPPDMKFEIKSELSSKIYPGQIIVYKIQILPFIKLSWVTEISQAKDENYFVDEQRFGPYKFWHHQHIFNEVENGIEVQDIVHYAIPFGIFGVIANKIFVEKKLKNIFEFRKNFLETRFK